MAPEGVQLTAKATESAAAPQILVVDDEVDIRAVLALALRRSGYQVRTAGDGLEALEEIRRQPPDLVILDVTMPRLDGFETLRRIRQSGATARLPVIMLTARAQPADRAQGVDGGADDYLAKPCPPSEVLARVRSVLGRQRPAGGVAGPGDGRRS